MKITSLVRHSKWFDVPEYENVKVEIRETLDSDIRDYAEGVMVMGGGTSAKMGSDFILQLRLDSISDWSGVVDEKGESLPPADERNRRAFLRMKGIPAFIDQCRNEVNVEAEKMRSDAAKN